MGKVIFTGGSGRLGQEIRKILITDNFLFPSSTEFNILNLQQCEQYISKFKIDKIIHAAAYTDVKQSEINYLKAIDINIIGTINLIKLCQNFNIKLIFISTDYVFDGDKGNYSVNEPINPLSKYAKSKAAAELAVRMYNNHLIIRTSFFGYDFPYDKAFIDQWSTKDYIDIIAPKILDACLSDDVGIKHIFSTKDTIYEKARKRNSNVLPILRKDIEGVEIPKDTSLI